MDLKLSECLIKSLLVAFCRLGRQADVTGDTCDGAWMVVVQDERRAKGSGIRIASKGRAELAGAVGPLVQ